MVSAHVTDSLRPRRLFAVLASLLLLVAFLVALQGGRPSAARSDPIDQLGTSWGEYEIGWNGTWTRRGTSDIWDAHWTQPGFHDVYAVLTITLTGNSVSIHRTTTTPATGQTCDYTGILNGTKVSGTYTCTNVGGEMPWNANIVY